MGYLHGDPTRSLYRPRYTFYKNYDFDSQVISIYLLNKYTFYLF
jgi:hypothetical protein